MEIQWNVKKINEYYDDILDCFKDLGGVTDVEFDCDGTGHLKFVYSIVRIDVYVRDLLTLVYDNFALYGHGSVRESERYLILDYFRNNRGKLCVYEYKSSEHYEKYHNILGINVVRVPTTRSTEEHTLEAFERVISFLQNRNPEYW